MNFLVKTFKDTEEKFFAKGKPLEKFYPLFEALDTFILTPGKTTKQAPHVRDAIDLKRVMIMVVVALIPCIIMGIYNVGYQMLLAKGEAVVLSQAMLLGAMKVLPIIIVTYAVGGIWEVLFAVVRKHEINEGFLVTGILFALTLPPTIPLWQVAVGISFGVVFGKEIFGGTGMNVFNPALVARAFVFFAYPAQLSGSNVWVGIDGFSKATALAVAKETPRGGDAVAFMAQQGFDFNNLFWGFVPGSIGETSAAACLLGLGLLLITRVASWRSVAGSVLGLVIMATIFNLIQGEGTLGVFSLPPHFHLIIGGFALKIKLIPTKAQPLHAV